MHVASHALLLHHPCRYVQIRLGAAALLLRQPRSMHVASHALLLRAPALDGLPCGETLCRFAVVCSGLLAVLEKGIAYCFPSTIRQWQRRRVNRVKLLRE